MSSEDLSTAHPGEVLAAARQTQAITQREVADVLHLPLHVIDAIERGDKSALPGYVFARGYVRAYAKLMELDPDPLVTALSQDYGAQEQAPPPIGDESGPGIAIHRLNLAELTPTHKLYGAIAAVVVLVLLIWLMWPAGETPGSEQPAELVQDPVVSEQDPSPQDLAPSPAVPREANTAARSQVVSEAETTDEGTAEALPDEAPLESRDLVEAMAAGQTEDNAASEVLLDEIVISVREDCWIEIKRNDGSVVYGDLGRAGDTVRVADQGPFSILLGYAPGVEMAFNGESIALAPHTRNNVATFVIGQ